jgi:ABC-type uncharacterized transport system substrate-binding protein
MSGKILIWLLATVFLTAASLAEAQQETKIPRVGVLVSGKPPTRPALEGFRHGLRDLGYVEGKNIILELRWNDTEDAEKWAKVAQDLVRLKPDVILATTGRASIGAKKATATIPIVMIVGNDPVELGLVESFARPGGNVTGMTFHGSQLNQKRLDLLKEAIPKTSPVAVLLNPSAGPGIRNEIETAARALSLRIQPLDVRAGDDLDGAFQAATRERARSLLVSQGALFATYRARIAELALKNRLPAISGESRFAEVGGLMFYGADIPDTSRRSARYVDKILKGAKPADLPVERSSKFELIVNLKTAKQIGVAVSPNVLARADKIIK